MSVPLSSAEDLTGVLRAELRAAGVRLRTREILPEPSPRDCLTAFLRFCRMQVASDLGLVDDDTVQVEASPVHGALDPTGTHAPPGAYRMSLSRRVTIADSELEAIKIVEATLEVYFGVDALGFGTLMLVTPGISASAAQLDPDFAGQYDGDLDGLLRRFAASDAAGILDLAALQGMLVGSVLYDAAE